MENKSHAFAAGLFALAFVAAAVLALYWLGGGSQDTREYVVVAKQNVSGLNPQAQVRYRGIRVGKVNDIRLDPDDYSNILISIEINDDVPLTKGTVAKLNYQGVTGLAHILLLETGKNPEPLPPNEADPPKIAMIPSLMEELSESGMATLKQARQLMYNLGDTLGDANRQHLATTLRNLAAASERLTPTLERLDGTLARVARLADERTVAGLAAAAQEAGPLLAETRGLVGRLQASGARFDALVGEADGDGAAALLPRLNELSRDVAQTSHQLNRVLRIVEETPQGLIFGPPALPPGPGEAGFVVPGGR